MNKFDIIIVGAGPGGLRCAEILAKSNKKVLLLEKKSIIGPKICAGGLTRKSFKLLGLPDEIVDCIHRGAFFNAPKIRTKFNLEDIYGYTISRERLGQWQLEKIKNSPVIIKTNAEVSVINKNSIKLKNGEVFEYEYLVGADGSNSIVRKFLRIPVRKIGVAFHYLVPQKFNDIEIFFNSKLFNSWYAWIFPHKNYTSIGSGGFSKILSVPVVVENFKKWAKQENIDISNGKFEAFPINCDYRGFHFGKTFLIGDAAGLASGFTGEGIYQALASGEDVAKMIIDPRHNPREIKKMRREVFIHHVMLALVWLSGPFRNVVFHLVTFGMRNKFVAKTIVRILT